MAAISINHVSIHATDLDESTAFYEQLLGLERIATPTFALPVQWLRLGRQQLHLFVRSDVAAPQFHHVGLNVNHFEAVYWRARAATLDPRIRKDLIALSDTVPHTPDALGATLYLDRQRA